MAVFANSAATQTAAVTNSSSKVFNASAAGIPTGAALGDITLVNTGTVTVFVGSFTGVTATTGVRVPAGASLTLSSFGAVQGSTNFDLYAITASGTSSVLVGPATTDYIS